MALTKNNFYSYITIAFLSFVLLSSTLFSFDFVSSQSSGTEVSGIITADTTWTQANSPYTLTGNILVQNGATLTIEPGTNVDLKNFYIMVNGTFIAIGTADQPINLSNGLINITSHADGWSEESGSGSQFIKTSIVSLEVYSSVPLRLDSINANATITLPNVSKIQNSIINADVLVGNSADILDNSIVGDLTVGEESTIRGNTINGSVTLGNSGELSQNIIYGLIQTGAVQLIDNSITGAIIINMQSTQNSTINSNVIRGGGYHYYYGLSFFPRNPTYPRSALIVEGGPCDIFNNTFICQSVSELLGIPRSDGGGFGITSQGDSVVHIYNNLITGGFTRGINAVGVAIIENNVIVNNNGGISVGKDAYEYAGLVSVGDKIIRNNLIANKYVGIDSFVTNNYYGKVDYEFVLDEQNVAIEGNTIVGNNIGIDIKNHILNIKNNTIYFSSKGIILGTQTSATIFFNDIQNFTDIQDSTQYCLYLDADTNSINATYNWWGTTDVGVITQNIYDYNDDFTLGLVTFTPVLSAPYSDIPIFIVASAEYGGSIEPTGYISLAYGDRKTFTITPDEGYHVFKILVNGSSVGVASSYLTESITGPTEIIVTFEANPTPTATPTPTPTPTLNPTPSPTPTASPSPTPTATVEPTPSPTPDSTPSLTPTPTDNQEDSGNFFFSPTFLIVIGVVVGVSIVIGGVLIWKKW